MAFKLMQNTRIFSNGIIVLVVVVAALISGVSFSSYNFDRNVLLKEESGSASFPLSALDHALFRMDFALNEYVSTGDEERLEGARLASQEARKILPFLDGSPRIEQSEALQDYLVQADKLIGDVEVALQESSSRAEIGKLANETHVFIDYYRPLIDEEVQRVLQQSEAVYAQLRQTTYRSLIISFMTMLAALLAMAYFVRMSARNAALASRNESLAKRAGALNDAKTRLLTMLSHQLRTPLNGILGLSNILLEDDLDENERVMIGEVRKSALDLSHVVNDMLDFTDFATISIEPKQNYILSYYLFEKLERETQKMAEDCGKNFRLELEGGIPQLFRGDYQRIYRSFYYAFRDILKHSPNQDFTASFAVVDNALIFKSDFMFQYDFDTEWTLEDFANAPVDDLDHGHSQGMDSTLARSLFETLGAQIKVMHHEEQSDMHRLLIKVPIGRNLPTQFYFALAEHDLVLPKELLDRLEALDAKFVKSLDRGDIIFARFSSQERGQVACLHEASPLATVIGVGQVVDIESYDYVINDPIWQL